MRNKRDKFVSPIMEDQRWYDTVYPNEFPIANYFCEYLGHAPSSHDAESMYSPELIEWFKNSQEYSLIWEHTVRMEDGELVPSMAVFQGNHMIITVKLKYSSDGQSGIRNISQLLNYDDLDDSFEEKPPANKAYLTIHYYHKSPIESLLESIKSYTQVQKSKSRISLVVQTRSGLETVRQNIKTEDVDIALNYGDSFVKVHEKIVDRLNEGKGKGLVLLHGVPGTGKTNYIRHLCGLLDKEIIFLPPFLAENLAGPDFIPFLLNHTNSILVIEDAEKIVLDRDGDSGSRQSVANLLNMTDGLLSDCLSIQIIATFNTSRDKIDKALLRKGRLIGEWKFDALSVENSNKLFKKLGIDRTTNKPLTLTEIYNIDEEVNVVQEERRAIGFNR